MGSNTAIPSGAQICGFLQGFPKLGVPLKGGSRGYIYRV